MDHGGHGHHHHASGVSLGDVDPLALAGFVATASYGFLTSLHCGAMCAPLVCARLGPKLSLRKPDIWVYNLGRGVSYPLGGAAVAMLGSGAARVGARLGQGVAVAVGVALVVLALATFLGRAAQLTRAASRVADALLRPTLGRLRGRTSTLQMLALGLMTVLLPCMTLTPTLLVAAASGSMAKGAAMLFAFFLGTLPAMVLAPIVPTLVTHWAPPRAMRAIAGIFLLVAGVVSLYRVWHGAG